ncbi:MAG: serine hydrolase [Acidobacteriaceae bacterium]|nr:serine hydrolase [Acidobacteriaceae bacterium]
MIQPQPDREIGTHFLIQPGWQNSGPHHWQSLWEGQLGHAAQRVPQQDWTVPESNAWTSVLEQTIRRTAPPVIILAHSIGCMATVFAIMKAPVAAVVLVAPADAERSNAPGALHTFTPIPMEPLATPALLVASDSDPYCTLDRAEAFAQAWKADLEIVTGGGHINADAGFGPWSDGWLMVGTWLRRHGLGWPKSESTDA